MSTSGNETRRYQIHEVLGKGGFGTVYRAELIGSGGFRKPVALKVLNPDMEGVEEIVQRLRDEAKMLGLLRHRALVQVDGLVQLDGRWTIVMEYVEGGDLSQCLEAHGPLPLSVVLSVAAEVAAALDVAYARPIRDGKALGIRDGKALGLLHRDIKPANIQTTATGEVKLLDFGVARANFGQREAKTQSVIYGSLPYMAPERLDMEDSHAGDIYALGVTMIQLLTGELPKRNWSVERNLESVRAVIDDDEVLDFLASTVAEEPSERPDARAFERRASELQARFPQPWLKDWAEEHVTPLLHRRGSSDELSGSLLMEQAITAVPASAIIPKREALSQQRRSGLRTVCKVFFFVGGFLVLLAVASTVGVAALTGGSCWLMMSSDSFREIEMQNAEEDLILMEQEIADTLPEESANREGLMALMRRGQTDAYTGKISAFERGGFENDVRRAMRDGGVTDRELEQLNKSYEAMLKD